MEYRRILYGYSFANGTYIIDNSESEIVKEIFKRYIGGESLKQISTSLTTRKIIYYKDKSEWNKRIVSRIIENQNYIGNLEYPTIISQEIFDKALDIKNSKSRKKHIAPPETEFLKKNFYCKNCGKPIRRISYRSSKEKWVCSGGCKFAQYIDDNRLNGELMSIITRIKDNSDLIRNVGNKVGYIPNLQVTRISNEIKRLTDRTKIEFRLCMRAVFECASAKFDCCLIDNSKEITDDLIHYIQETKTLTLDFYQKAIKQITIDTNGKIEVYFTNDSVLSNKERTV